MTLILRSVAMPKIMSQVGLSASAASCCIAAANGITRIPGPRVSAASARGRPWPTPPASAYLLRLKSDDRLGDGRPHERAHELLHSGLAALIPPLLDLSEQNCRRDPGR